MNEKSEEPVYKFPSDRVLPLDWQKLASVDLQELFSDNLNLDTLQENLNHVAFCQINKEIHLENASDQRNLIKLFRLAQLIIQYLFISQEYMGKQLDEAKNDCEKFEENYELIKQKLKTQIEEAKKLKKFNKNLNETSVYFSTLLAAYGALEHYLCPMCPKAFRSGEFLFSHVQRRHENEADTVKITDCRRFNLDSKFGQNKAAKNEFFKEGSKSGVDSNKVYVKESDSTILDIQKYCLNCSEAINPPLYSAIESKFCINKDKVTEIYKDNNNEILPFSGSDKNLNIRSENKELENVDKKESQIIEFLQNDVKTLNEVIVNLSNDLKTQNDKIELQFKKKNNVMNSTMEEKNKIIENYERTIKQLEDKVEYLEKEKQMETITDNETILDLIRNQNIEFLELKEKLNRDRLFTEDSSNLRNEELSKTSLESASPQQNLQSSQLRKTTADFEEKKSKLKRKLGECKETEIERKQLKTSKSDKIDKKPPLPGPRQKFLNKSAEEIKSSEITKNEIKQSNDVLDASESDTETSKWFQTERKTKLNEQAKPLESKESQNASSSKYIGQKSVFLEQTSSESGEESTSDCMTSLSRRSNSIKNENVVVFSNNHLKEMIDEDPLLWNQMKSVIEKELQKKLEEYEIFSNTGGLTDKELDICLTFQRKGQKILKLKYENYNELKSEITSKLKDKFNDKIGKRKEEKEKISDRKEEREKISDRKENTSALGHFKSGIFKFKSKVASGLNLPELRIIKQKTFRKKTGNFISRFQRKSRDQSTSLDAENFSDSDSTENMTCNKKTLKRREKTVRRKLFSDNSPKPNPFNHLSHFEQKILSNANTDDEENEETLKNLAYKFNHKQSKHKHTKRKLNDRKNSGDHKLNSFEVESLKPKIPEREIEHSKNYDHLNRFSNDEAEEWDSSSLSENDGYDVIKHSTPIAVNETKFLNESNTIKLKKPTGRMVTQISQQIQSQLQNRNRKKIPGAIDILGSNEKQRYSKEVSSDFSDIEAILISD